GDAGTEADGAHVGLAHAGEDSKEARLARAVQAHHQEPLGAPEVELDLLEHGRSAVALREAVHLQGDPSRIGRLGEAEPNAAHSLRRGDRVRAETLDAAVQGLRLAGAFLGLVAHRIGEGLQALDLRLLARRDLRLALLVLAPRHAVLRVGATIVDEP